MPKELDQQVAKALTRFQAQLTDVPAYKPVPTSPGSAWRNDWLFDDLVLRSSHKMPRVYFCRIGSKVAIYLNSKTF